MRIICAGQSTYIGGYDDLARLDESGELRQLVELQQKRSASLGAAAAEDVEIRHARIREMHRKSNMGYEP